LRFDYDIQRGADGELLASGYTVHVCVDRDRKVLKPPAYLMQTLQANARELEEVAADGKG
jgi:acyl-CoA thioester hydrolase